MRRWTLPALVVAVAAALAPSTASAGVPVRYEDQVFDSVEVQHDLVYGRAAMDDAEPQDLKLDLFRPAGDVGDLRPVVIYAHGGAWRKGFKDSDHDWPYPDDYARRGYVAASMDYRLDGSEEDATDDMQAAVRWFRANAAELGIDPNRIAVIGSSSGAVMALSTAFDPENPGDSGNPGYPSNVAAAFSISGDAQHPDTITAGDPPIAMFHALDDTTIPYADGQATCQQTRAKGNVCEMYTYPTGGHPPPFAIANRSDIVWKSSTFFVRQAAIDTVGPATGDDVPAGWARAPVPVTLSADDGSGGSGALRTYYTTGVDPAEPTTASAVYDPAAKPALGDGERIRYFSVDRAGNAGPVAESRAAQVDTSPPDSAASAVASTESSALSVGYTASEVGSGLDRVELWVKRSGDAGYSLAATSSAPEGTFAYDADAGYGDYAFYTVAYDAAGNAEAVPAAPDAVTTLLPPPTRAVTLVGNALAERTGGTVTASLSNPNPYDVTGLARLRKANGGAPLGPARTFSIAAGARAPVTITLPPAARDLLARKRQLPVRVVLSTRGLRGGPVASSKTLVLKAAAKQRRGTTSQRR